MTWRNENRAIAPVAVIAQKVRVQARATRIARVLNLERTAIVGDEYIEALYALGLIRQVSANSTMVSTVQT